MSKSSCSLISLLSSDGGEGGDSMSILRPAFLSDLASFCCCCSGVASVVVGLTRSQVNMWYRLLFLLFWAYCITPRLSRSTISSSVSGVAGGVGSISLMHKVRI